MWLVGALISAMMFLYLVAVGIAFLVVVLAVTGILLFVGIVVEAVGILRDRRTSK